MQKTDQTLLNLKTEDQDFEWYPTTDAIIKTVCGSILKHCKANYNRDVDIMDCGAGDGRVLLSIRDNLKQANIDAGMFAIEKSSVLIEAMDKDIAIVGTEFDEQSLLDKEMDVIFCNPPYSVFENWMLRITNEGFAKKIILVVPVRWKKSERIQKAIKERKWLIHSLGEFDFLNAERAARARVDIVVLDRKESEEWNSETKDPFDAWFSKEFKFAETKDSYEETIKRDKQQRERFNVVRGRDLIQTLAELYRADLAGLLDNYKTLSMLDADLLRELGVDTGKVKDGMSSKIKGLKNLYWSELLNRMGAITKRLTKETRENFVRTMMSRHFIDFTESNAYAIVVWTLKNVNQYFDSQLCAHYRRMTEPKNVLNYKSNFRMIKDAWRFQRGDEDFSHYKLDYRMVLQNHESAFEFDWGGRTCEGLDQKTWDYISDTFVIANNLGFKCDVDWKPKRFWRPGEQVEHRCIQPDGKNEVFAEIRVYKNGNIHMKLNQKFMLAFNVEAARINKWVRSPAEAAEQMGEKLEDVEQAFKGNLQLPLSVSGLLGA